MEIAKAFRPYEMTDHCQRVYNPIRNFVENEIASIPSTEFPPSRPKDPVNVSYGDPCVYKDFKPNPENLEALVSAVGKHDGYVEWSGIPEVRGYLKDFYTARGNFKVEDSDVYVTHGCSLALWLAINTLAEKGDNVIVPNPGFPLAKAIAKSQHIGIKEYLLLPHQNWEIDLNDLEAHIDENTRAILVNNPSNPTGAIFSRGHMLEILKVAEKHRLPIIADEVYEDMVYPGLNFVSFIEVSTKVPIFLCSGLSKKQFAPGWRTGWLVLNGPKGVFDQVKIGLDNLMTFIMNSNTICMQSIPQMLERDPAFLKGKMEKIKSSMAVLKENLNDCECYEVLPAQGAMYAVVLVDVEKLEGINDTREFCIQIFKNFNVLCFPGECFGGKNFIRVVTCSDEAVLKELCKRMKEFYCLYRKK